MPDILRSLKSEEMVDFSQNYAITRPGAVDSILFPDRKSNAMKYDFERLSEGATIPTMAMFHALDSEAAIGTRPTKQAISYELLYIKEKINQSEKTQRYLQTGAPVSDIVRYIFGDAARLFESVLTRARVAKYEAFTTGKMTIVENGLNMVVDYGIPEEAKFKFDWTDPSADIIGQLRSVVTYLMDMGYPPTDMMLSTMAVQYMLTNAGIQKAINGNLMAGVYVTREQAFNFLSSIMPTPIAFRVADSQTYQYVKPDGSKGTAKFYKEKAAVLYQSAGNGAAGFGLWGTTPEELNQKGFDSVSMSQFITLSQWSTQDPVALWTKASASFIPVIPNPTSMAILDISSNELTRLTVGSAAGAAAGKSKITVSPALGSGRTYVYKTGATITQPTLDRTLSSGWTAWDGTADITAVTGNDIAIAEIDATKKCKASGTARVVAKA